MRVSKLACLSLCLGAAALVACDSSSDFETYVATLEGAQENPPTGSTASGRAVVQVSKSSNRVDVSVVTTGLVNGTQAHIHRAPRGTNGSVIFWLWQPGNPLYPEGPENVGKSWVNPSFDTRDIPLTDQVLADLRAGNLYVNFHTTRNPGGDIRGQLSRQ